MEQDTKRRLISDFVNRRTWAVVGASQDRSKFGNRVLRSMRDSGYVVYPVNPKGGHIEGLEVHRTLADLPEQPEVVDLVVPPSVSEQIVREAQHLGLNRIWFQPGSESVAALAYCSDHGMQVVHDACAMVWKREWATLESGRSNGQ